MDQSTGRLYSIVFCARQLLMHVITENVAPADINTHPTTCCSISLGDTDEDTQWSLWKRTNNRVALQQIKRSVSLLLDEIDDQWNSYVTHHHCMKAQQLYISEIKKVQYNRFYLCIVSLPWLLGVRSTCDCSCANGFCPKFLINIAARSTISTLRQTTGDYLHGPGGDGGYTEELRNSKRLSRACKGNRLAEFSTTWTTSSI